MQAVTWRRGGRGNSDTSSAVVHWRVRLPPVRQRPWALCLDLRFQLWDAPHDDHHWVYSVVWDPSYRILMLLATRTGRSNTHCTGGVCQGHGSAVDYRPSQGMVKTGMVYIQILWCQFVILCFRCITALVSTSHICVFVHAMELQCSLSLLTPAFWWVLKAHISYTVFNCTVLRWKTLWDNGKCEKNACSARTGVWFAVMLVLRQPAIWCITPLMVNFSRHNRIVQADFEINVWLCKVSHCLCWN